MQKLVDWGMDENTDLEVTGIEWLGDFRIRVGFEGKMFVRDDGAAGSIEDMILDAHDDKLGYSYHSGYNTISISVSRSHHTCQADDIRGRECFLQDGEHPLEGDGAVIHQHDVRGLVGLVGCYEQYCDLRIQQSGDFQDHACGRHAVPRLPVRDSGPGDVQLVRQPLLGEAALYPQAAQRVSEMVFRSPIHVTSSC
jgi:hypothetical protein